MGTGSRQLNLDGGPSIGRPHAMGPARADVAARAGAAGLALANELLGRSDVSLDTAEQALERLRQSSQAIETSFWLVSGATARCVVRVGDHGIGQPLPTIALENHGSILARVRHRGAWICRDREVSGLEDLVPAAASSYAVLSCVNDMGVIGLLALGWDRHELHADDTSISYLQIATGALLRTLRIAERRQVRERISDGVADALPIPIWIHDAAGRVQYGNAAWREASEAVHALRGIDAGDVQWLDLVHPDDRARGEAAFRDALATDAAFAVAMRLFSSTGAYRWFAVTGAPYHVDASIGQGYLGCACDITAQRHAEHALGEMGSRVVAAQEGERSRIARELHDDLGQQAAVLATKIETLLRSSRASAANLRDGIADAKQNVQDLAVAIHNLSHELHPPKLKLLGLVRTISSLCTTLSKDGRVVVTFDATTVPEVPESVALCICRVAQEALQNAIKHSGATRIDVTLAALPSQLVLRVTDTGRGFDPSAAVDAGIGLLTMRDRVELNGGHLRIDAVPMSGTTIEASLPIPAPL